MNAVKLIEKLCSYESEEEKPGPADGTRQFMMLREYKVRD